MTVESDASIWYSTTVGNAIPRRSRASPCGVCLTGYGSLASAMGREVGDTRTYLGSEQGGNS